MESVTPQPKPKPQLKNTKGVKSTKKILSVIDNKGYVAISC